MIRSLLLVFSLATLWAAPAGPKAQKDVLAAMEALNKATIGKDVAALDKLFNDNLTYTHSSAQNQNKAEVLKAVGADKSTIEAIDLTDTTVHVFGTAALLRTDFHIRRTTNGNTATTNLNILFAWVKTAHGWQLAARHATAIPAK